MYLKCTHTIQLLLTVFSVSLFSIHMKGATNINLSLKATSISASVEGSENSVSMIADGTIAGTQYWSSYQGKEVYGEEAYVEFTWSQNCVITQTVAYWAVDGDSISLPTEAYLMRWDGHEWAKAFDLSEPNSSNVSTTKDTVETNRIRLCMRSEAACGLYELRLFGYEIEGCEAAVLSGNTAIAFPDEGEVELSPILTLPVGVEEEPIWNWTLPDGTTATTQTITATSLGTYKVSYQRECGVVTTMTFTVYDASESYSWEDYSPTLAYDYHDEYSDLQAPTQFLPEDNNQKGYLAEGWWAIAWGPKTSMYVTDVAKQGILDKMNEDFQYFRDEMGWPPDKRARNGYYSTIYVYGSGLYGDSADSTDTGGWQSATYYNGSSWPMVYLSYYPIACFDPAFTYDSYSKTTVTDQTYQQDACVHEGIHAIFADLDGCKNSAWYQEAGNTWLQSQAAVKRSGTNPTSMGWLSAGNMIAPFMPIECYSGWLLDGSFGGPSAEGVNMYNSSGAQICTWRNLLGGVQYGELFPHFVAEILGEASIPWIWRYCKSRVLEGMADTLGDTQMRRFILEYRSRQALVDVGAWSTACRNLLDDNWLVSIQQEWEPYWQAVDVWKATPYVNMYACESEDSLGWYYPEYRTTPGWSGANQIPLHINATVGKTISLHFKPLGENMVAQLCYRTSRGKTYYSYPIEGEGDVVMYINEAPANGVVFAVVCNTDYIYEGEATRKKHFDYRLKMGDNIYQPANSQLQWYNYRKTITDSTFDGIEETITEDVSSSKFEIIPAKTLVHAGENLPLKITAASQLYVQVRMYSISGELIYAQSFMRNGDLHIPSNVTPGVYILNASNAHDKSSVKIIVTN